MKVLEKAFFLNAFQWRGCDSSGQALVKDACVYAFVFLCIFIVVSSKSLFSTFAWNFFIARSWSSSRWSWRKQRWTWWVSHKVNRKNSRSQYAELSFLRPWLSNIISATFRVNMNFLRWSWMPNWLRSYTETLRKKSKVGPTLFFSKVYSLALNITCATTSVCLRHHIRS